MKEIIADTRKSNLFNMHHRIKLQLDAICQEAGDMNLEEFMQVYESLKNCKCKRLVLWQSNISLLCLTQIPKQEYKLLKYNNKVCGVKFISRPLDLSAVIVGNR